METVERPAHGNRVPADLIFSLKLGWQFGGVAMLAFGVIVTALLVTTRSSERGNAFPISTIGVAYVAFGVWALFSSGFDPFFAIFVVPGILLLLATIPTKVKQSSD